MCLPFIGLYRSRRRPSLPSANEIQTSPSTQKRAFRQDSYQREKMRREFNAYLEKRLVGIEFKPSP